MPTIETETEDWELEARRMMVALEHAPDKDDRSLGDEEPCSLTDLRQRLRLWADMTRLGLGGA